MKQFLTLVLGTDDVLSFASLAFFALLGVILSLLWHVTKRDPKSPESPIPFVLEYMLIDNLKRLVIGLILVFAALRFSEQLLGLKLNHFVAFIIGVSFDNLGKFIQNKQLN